GRGAGGRTGRMGIVAAACEPPRTPVSYGGTLPHAARLGAGYLSHLGRRAPSAGGRRRPPPMHTRLLPRPALAGGLGALLAPAPRADVKLHPRFTDHAVLQRGIDIPVWGTADPGEQVKVVLTSDGKTAGTAASATADEKGRWKAKLPKQSA